MVKGLWIAGTYLVGLLVSYLALGAWYDYSFKERFGLSVDLAVTATAIFESAGGIIMLASFIRDKHIEKGRKEKEEEIQRKIGEWRVQGLSDAEILERLTLNRAN